MSILGDITQPKRVLENLTRFFSKCWLINILLSLSHMIVMSGVIIEYKVRATPLKLCGNTRTKAESSYSTHHILS